MHRLWSLQGTPLHDRILRGDDRALTELFAWTLPLLQRRLRSVFTRAPDTVIIDGTADAVADYAARPHIFQASRGASLETFLFRASWRNVRDLLRADERRHRREAWYVQSCRWHGPSEKDSALSLDDLRTRLLELGIDHAERAALERWLDGTRHTSALAQALGVGHLPALEQRREVKRFKDRLTKRMARLCKVDRLSSSSPSRRIFHG